MRTALAASPLGPAVVGRRPRSRRQPPRAVARQPPGDHDEAFGPTLNSVFGELFLPTSDAQLTLYRLDGLRVSDRTISYGRVETEAKANGLVAFGLVLEPGTPSERVVLCPRRGFEWKGPAQLVALRGSSGG